MTTITIADLATAPQIDSRRVARDLIEWLADRGWVIVRGQIELPFGCDPHPPAPLSTATVALTLGTCEPATNTVWDSMSVYDPYCVTATTF